MCFFSKISKEAVEVEHRFNAKFDKPEKYKKNDFINGFTFPQTPVIKSMDRDVIFFYNWGLIPTWAKDDSIRKYTLNAKIETLNEKPSFKNSVNKRCLVIADGFYEWQWLDLKGKNKQKYLITLTNDELFSFAGIWSEWTNTQTGEIVYSYSILTTEANELMSEIHNSKKRMPVLLTKEYETQWLDNCSLEFFKNLNIDLKAEKIIENQLF